MSIPGNPLSYLVPVFNSSDQRIDALLGPAQKEDLPTDWTCDWPNFWDKSDFACQAIVRLSVGTDLWGLIRYGLYPYPSESQKAKFLFIENLESHPSRRVKESFSLKPSPQSGPEPWIGPVGKWLIWHACREALAYCRHDASPLVTVTSLEDAVDYYRDRIGMNMGDAISCAPGEDCYGFTFEKNEAENFCLSQEAQYGMPKRIAIK